MGPGQVLRGIVARLLPTSFIDDRDNDKPLRTLRYGEAGTISLVRKTHGLADEGSYFVAGNAQTGIITSLLGTTISDTTLSPYLIITNTDNPNNQGAKSICLDYLNLICTVVGAFASAGTTLNFSWSTEQVNSRYSSGGTDLTKAAATNGGIFNVNTGVAMRASIAQINVGALTLNAAGPTRRTIVPQRQMRVQNSTTVGGAAQDEVHMNFGSVERVVTALLDLTTAKTVGYREVFNVPAIEIAPGHCAILHLWSPGAALTTGITYLPELGWWER